MHRLAFLAEAEAGVVYTEKFYGLRIPAFSDVDGDEMEDTVMSETMQGQAKTDGHRVGEGEKSKQLIWRGDFRPHVTRTQDCIYILFTEKRQ